MRSGKVLDLDQVFTYQDHDDSRRGFNGDSSQWSLLWKKAESYDAGVQIDHVTTKRVRLRRRVIVSGWACDLRILCDGRRQIFAFLVPGDVIAATLSDILTPRVVVALTPLLLVDRAPELGEDDDQEAEWRSDAILAARRQERLCDQLVRIGRLSARERTIHLLLELHHRLDQVGLVKDDTFRAPVNQEVLADALGMSVVHINRTLRELRNESLVMIKAGVVTLGNMPKLAAISGYVPPN